MKNASNIENIGTKLINKAALVGPMFLIASRYQTNPNTVPKIAKYEILSPKPQFCILNPLIGILCMLRHLKWVPNGSQMGPKYKKNT